MSFICICVEKVVMISSSSARPLDRGCDPPAIDFEDSQAIDFLDSHARRGRPLSVPHSVVHRTSGIHAAPFKTNGTSVHSS